MKLEISLPKGRMLWALHHPTTRAFIKGETGLVYQETNLILTQADPGPKTIELNEYPEWAQDMIK